MLSCVLNSDIAIEVNINIMRAFVQLRRIGLTYMELKRKIDSMERNYDHQFKIVFNALRQLIEPPPEKKPKRRIGFAPPEKEIICPPRPGKTPGTRSARCRMNSLNV